LGVTLLIAFVLVAQIFSLDILIAARTMLECEFSTILAKSRAKNFLHGQNGLYYQWVANT
jgi:hypothetical protein